MKEEKAVIPILTGIVLAMIASHIMTWDHPTADVAEFALLFASVAFILGGIYMYCSMTAQNSKSIARQMLELEEVTD
jgi:Ni,Fe-hydrogenase I cytochrome b subunit